MISEDYHCVRYVPGRYFHVYAIELRITTVSVSHLFGLPQSWSIFVYEWPHLSVALTPSQRAAAIPHASHTPFVCPSTSHNLTHRPRPPSMHPDAFRRASPLLDAPPPSQTRPARPSCAADQLQFLLTSNGISFYFPSILLFQLFSSLSLAIASLLVNIMNITMTSL